MLKEEKKRIKQEVNFICKISNIPWNANCFCNDVLQYYCLPRGAGIDSPYKKLPLFLLTYPSSTLQLVGAISCVKVTANVNGLQNYA